MIKIIKRLSEPFYAFVNRKALEDINKDAVGRLIQSGELIESMDNLIISRKLYEEIKET